MHDLIYNFSNQYENIYNVTNQGNSGLDAIIGVVLGAILGFVATLVKSWIDDQKALKNAPKLKIEYDEKNNVSTNKGNYIRAKVKNAGKTNAKNVRVLISGIKICDNGSQNFDDWLDNYDRPWAGMGETLEIPSNVSRLFDIVTVKNGTLVMVQIKGSYIRPFEKNISCKVEADIYVSADNAETVSYRLSYDFDHDNHKVSNLTIKDK